MRSLYKILHTTCQRGWGDLETRIFNESIWMEKNGHQIIIVAPLNSPLFLKAKQHGFRVYGLEFKFFSMMGDYGRLKKIFYDEKPGIINTHGRRDSRIALLAAKNARVPCRILSNHVHTRVRNSWVNRIVYKKLCHYIFTTCDAATTSLQTVFKLKDMEIFSMPSGIIEPDSLVKKEDARKNLAKTLGLDPGTRFIGFAGNLSSFNGLKVLFNAFKLIIPQLPGHHLAIAGEGTIENLASLETLAEDLNIRNQVHFTQPGPDTWTCYRAFDCSILPCEPANPGPVEEIFPELLNAMICECPVISCLAGNGPDIEKASILFKASDPSDLAHKILETLQNEDETRKRVQAARDLVKKQYTIDAMGRNIIRIYRLHQVKLDRRFF